LVHPASALVVRAEGPQVAVVQEGQKIHFQKIELGRNYGVQVEVMAGVNDSDLVVTNPTDEVQEGVEVIIRVHQSDAQK